MSKTLIACCDGTWNTPDQPSPTNVVKLALALADRDRNGRVQRSYYQRGVGTNGRDRLRGGAFGLGLSRDVRSTYRFLVQNYDRDDDIFLLGFSRGAYIARSTAGLIRNCGILRRDQADRIDEAYRLYRDRTPGTNPNSTEARLFRRSYSFEPRIRFIGVWDTVGALGIPLNGPRWANLINRRWQFHDTDLSSRVDAAFHALAIDEKRKPFRPTIWNTTRTDGQRVEQVWFAGAHSDVGGGNADRALADVALLWMMDRAQQFDLAFDPDAVSRIAPGVHGTLHESRTGFFRLLPAYERPIGVTDRDHEHAASSAVDRHRASQRYSPRNLLAYLRGAGQIIGVRPGPADRTHEPA